MANDIIQQLNHLVSIDKNSEAGFNNAAGHVRNSEIESLFRGYAKQHAKFAAEIQEEVERLGGNASNTGTVGGTIHRGWMDLKSAVSGHSVGAMLTSCQDGEQSAESAYLDMLELKPTGKILALLEKHLQQIKEIRTRLARLVGEVKDGVEFPSNE